MNMSAAQLGLAGATGSANAQLGTATNVANLGIGAANATAAGQIGSANAYGGALSNLGNAGIGYGLSGFNNPGTQNYPTQYGSGIENGSIGTGGFTPTAGNSFTIA
jgi:hypothetical protein